jgi:hypothetical protein
MQREGLERESKLMNSLEQQNGGENSNREQNQNPFTLPALQVTGVVEDDTKNGKNIKNRKQHGFSLLYGRLICTRTHPKRYHTSYKFKAN